MSASNNRVSEHMTYHHLMSRIAHRVYFMTEEVRNDFIEMVRRAADFCGVKLIAWCVMTNHFHLLVFLPNREELSEAEILRRYGVLKGRSRLSGLVEELDALRKGTDGGAEKIKARLDAISRPMYDIGEFMKIVKQWMTQDYNRRNSHVGTLWESVYKDVLVADNPTELAKRAAYIHLNPVRAAICTGFSEYVWSSFTAFSRRDDIAVSGMRRIYGDEAEIWEISRAHHELMMQLLEQVKLERAQDIARKRQAGFDVPADPLTTEALIAQAEAHLKSVMTESVEDKDIRRARGRPSKSNDLANEIALLLKVNPTMSIGGLVEATGCSRSTVYRCIKAAKDRLSAKQ